MRSSASTPRRVEVEAHLQRGRAGVRDRRPRRPRLPGGEGARAQRHRVGGARVAGAADHGQPRAGGAAQGGLGLRPADRARGARGLAAAAAGARSAGTRRSASSRSTGGCGRSAACSRRPRARGGPGSTRLLCAAESAPEAALAGIEPVPVHHLAEAVAYLRGEWQPPPPDEPPAGAERLRAGGAGPRRRARPGARAARARDRRGRRPQPAARRAAGHRQDDARAAAAGDPAAARADEALEVTRIHSVAGLLPPGRPLVSRAAVPGAAPHGVGGGDRRRRLGPAARRGEPRAPRRALPRRAAGVPAAARSRRCASRSRTASSAIARVGGQARLPGALPARRRR